MWLKSTALSFLVSTLVLTGCQTLNHDRARDTASVKQMQLELDKALAELEEQQESVQPPPSVTAELLPVLPVQQAPAEEQERFDIAVDGVTARDFFIGLVKGTEFNVVVPPDLSGALSLDLQNVTIDEVMQIVRDTYGYDYVQRGNLYRVLPNGMRTQIFKIDYLNIQRMGSSETLVSSGQVSSAGSSDNSSGSSRDDDDNNSDDGDSDSKAVIGTRLKTNTDADFWSGLAQTVGVIIGDGDNRRVVVSPQSGMVIVHALAGELRAVKEFLDKAELSLRRQVILEAKILEVQLNDGFQAGVNWSALAKVGDGKNVIFGTGLKNSVRTIDPVTGITTLSSTTLETPTAVNTPSDSVGGVFSAALNLKDFNVLIDLLSTQGAVQVLSSPRISTVNNQKAVIKVGTDEFFVTEISSDTTTNTSSTTSTDVELTPFFSGIALDVTPQISEGGEVILHIHPTVSEVRDQTKTVVGPNGNLVLPLALSSIRETDSIVRARNGQVVVIGGLMQNSSTDNNAKTPLLGDVPLLGKAFRQKRQGSVKSELVILLKPVVADDDAWQNSIEDSKQRISEFQQVFQPSAFD